MLGKVYTGTLQGIDGVSVCVEADIGEGLPQFDMVGFLGSEVREARERVKTAIKNTGIFLPPKRYTINLSPADLKKQGNFFDLPIAVAILVASGVLMQSEVSEVFMVGELSLNGELRPVDGTLPLIMRARDMGMKACIVPCENGMEASIVKGIDVFALKDLREVIGYINCKEEFLPIKNQAEDILNSAVIKTGLDYSEINGQYAAKKASEIAAAGNHNILYIGPPGSGKTMLAKRLPGIMPKLTLEEAVEITKIYSITGMLGRESALITDRPFRSPHHTSSLQALVGGGRIPRPGEVTLAHLGVLFLDEATEQSRANLDGLRIPLEDHEVILSRVHGSYHFPARFQLVAAMNPCACGYYPDRTRCHCTQNDINKYLSKLSQPFLDRIDLCVEVSRLKYDDLISKKENESSEKIRERVMEAVERQRFRYRDEKILFNSQLTPKMLDKYCRLGSEEEKLLKNAFDNMNLSARAYHRVIKVGRTIADLEGAEEITAEHLCEAIGYRTFDKEVWR